MYSTQHKHKGRYYIYTLQYGGSQNTQVKGNYSAWFRYNVFQVRDNYSQVTVAYEIDMNSL